ncbi:MAG: dTMP kinase [Bdellovibrionales bacterium]
MAFIVFEGLDGAGKSTLIQKLKDHLSHSNIMSKISREPGGTSIGEEVRKILLRTDAETPVPTCELLLYEAIRAQHVQTVIKPTLEKGHWVLCDRFAASTIAFQAAGRSIDMKDVEWLNQFATGGLKPDLYILIDVTNDLSFMRLQKRIQTTGQAADRFESEKKEFHEKVRQGYLKLAQEEASHWLVLDGAQDPQQLFDVTLKYLRSKKWLP